MFLRLLATFTFCTYATHVAAFCGFYVARADGQLFNEASKVVFVRDKNRSTITMSSDYQGTPKDFAMVVPTPKVLRRNQIKTVNAKTVDHLDAYSAPRLVEYHDHDPCGDYPEPVVLELAADSGPTERQRGARALGVTIKAEYSVDSYDILILDAKQSDGLITFLRTDGYNIPDGLDKTLGHYIKGGMKFFVAKVNLKRHSAAKKQTLKPLQISFRSRDFMLPIQLGKTNAKGVQDLLLMTLTRTGQVEVANYPTRQIPTNNRIPTFVKEHFGAFYTDMLKRQTKGKGVMMEYAWDMAWCDPCAADPLSNAELKELGVSWVRKSQKNAGQDVFVTRLHAQYSANNFKKDLVLRETGDRTNFQGRYVMNHPHTGSLKCEGGKEYLRDVRKRLKKEAGELRKLTGWSRKGIDTQIRKSVPAGYY